MDLPEFLKAQSYSPNPFEMAFLFYFQRIMELSRECLKKWVGVCVSGGLSTFLVGLRDTLWAKGEKK